VNHVTCMGCLKDTYEIAEEISCKIYYFILMYVPCSVYNLLIRPINAQYINSNVSFIKYSMFRCIYTIFRELFILYMITLKNQ